MTTTTMSAASILRLVLVGARVVNPEELSPAYIHTEENFTMVAFLFLTDKPYLTVEEKQIIHKYKLSLNKTVEYAKLSAVTAVELNF